MNSIWSSVFWTLFIGIGLIMVLLTKLNIIFIGIFVGLIIIFLGIQKIIEYENFRYIHMTQKNKDKRLDEMSSFLEAGYIGAKSGKNYEEGVFDMDEETQNIQNELQQELKKRLDENNEKLEKIAKKMLELENKMNQISKAVVENWGRIQDEQAAKTKKPREVETNQELREKLKKAMSG